MGSGAKQPLIEAKAAVLFEAVPAVLAHTCLNLKITNKLLH